MRIFKNKVFSRYARRSGITNTDLFHTVIQINQGIIDANLGGGVIKQRMARPNEGKSGGFRTIVLFRTGDLAFFVYGFAKNERSNISTEEMTAFRRLANELLAYDAAALAIAIEVKALTEVLCQAADIAVEEAKNASAL